MKNFTNTHQPAKSLYSMLAKSEHEERSAFEGAVYMLFMLSAVFSIWHVAHQSVETPAALVPQTAHYAQAAAIAPQQGT